MEPFKFLVIFRNEPSKLRINIIINSVFDIYYLTFIISESLISKYVFLCVQECEEKCAINRLQPLASLRSLMKDSHFQKQLQQILLQRWPLSYLVFLLFLTKAEAVSGLPLSGMRLKEYLTQGLNYYWNENVNVICNKFNPKAYHVTYQKGQQEKSSYFQMTPLTRTSQTLESPSIAKELRTQSCMLRSQLTLAVQGVRRCG